MANRKIRNSALSAKIETTAGTDAEPTGADNAILLSDLTIDPLDASNIDRDLIRGYFGASEQLVGTANVKAGFSVELAGSGTAGTAPAFGVLLQACALAEAVLASPARVEYTPVSTGLKTATMDYVDDGLLHKLLGSMGTMSLSAKIGERATMKFDFIAQDGGRAEGSISPVYTAFKKPVALTMANVVDITLGCTYSAGALSSGTEYSSTGLDLSLGNAVAFNALLNQEFVDITDREVTGKLMLKLTAAQEITFAEAVKANTTQSLGFTIGTVGGNTVILFMPAVQLINYKKSEMNGNRMISFDLRAVPVAGNDELRIIFK